MPAKARNQPLPLRVRWNPLNLKKWSWRHALEKRKMTKFRHKVVCIVSWRKPESSERLYLLLQTTNAREAFWQPVTGGVDEGENLTDAALREAMEETGLYFSRAPQNLGFSYEAQDRRGNPTRESCFHLSIVAEECPTPKLDGIEHQAFGWFPLAEAMGKVRFSQNAKALEIAAQPLLFLSKRGVFFQEGEEITHERTVKLLHEKLVKEGDHFWVRLGSEQLEVIVEDTAKFITAYDASTGEIRTLSGRVEKLNPKSLQQRIDHSFVCNLSDGSDAIFLSRAHYELAESIKEESGKYVFHFLGQVYPLRVSS
jgi:8-oxo-dGTP pyrophosphatase MutT (NUDIX family)